jgi:Holliday junction resolvase RusA-like endonuclease
MTGIQLLSGHWAQAARKKKSDARMVWAYAASAQVPKATGKRSLELTIILEKRQRAADPDAYFKSTCDALVRCGLLTDDNRQGVELLPIKYERGERKATRIILKDLV